MYVMKNCACLIFLEKTRKNLLTSHNTLAVYFLCCLFCVTSEAVLKHENEVSKSGNCEAANPIWQNAVATGVVWCTKAVKSFCVICLPTSDISVLPLKQGCQIFLGARYQNREYCTK
jgi:hypothetical protein